MNAASVADLAEPPAKTLLGVNVSQALILKVAASTVLAMAGGYYLLQGKKDQNVGAMLFGAVLILLSLLVFC